MKSILNNSGDFSMNEMLKNSAGFSMVGALTAAGIGAIAVLGLTQMSSNIVGNLSKSKQIFNMVTLSEEIRQSFMEGAPTPCDHNAKDCWNACTSSLIGISTSGAGQNFAIKTPSLESNNFMGAGPILYTGEESYTDTDGTAKTGGGVYKGIKIQEIKYVPYASNLGIANVHFSLTEDARETLTAPQSLVFTIFVKKESGGVIEECVVASTKIAGGGLAGIGESCRKVDGDPLDTPPHPAGKKQTLLGCGGTDGKNGEEKPEEDVAFGYKSGGDFDANSGAGEFSDGEGNTFFGYKSGWKNTSGEHNVFLGHEAGRENTTGNNNVFLGYQAGENNTADSDNILIGRKASSLSGYKLNIGDLILYPSGSDEVVLKGQVRVEPPVDLPIADPPGTLPTAPNGFFSAKTTSEPGLYVKGEMSVHKKDGSSEIKFKTGGSKTLKIGANVLNIVKQDLEAKGTPPPPPPPGRMLLRP